MSQQTRPLILIFLTSLIAFCLGETGNASDTPEKVLFVGNSYTGGVKRELSSLFAASPHRGIKMEFIHPGGCTLARHLENGKTMDTLKSGGWDLVVLQEQSQTPAYPGPRRGFVAAAEKMDKAIRESGAGTVFYQTWGRRDGDKRNARLAPDYATMQDLLTEGYAEAAKNTGARVAPVGEAWRLIWKRDPELARSLYQKDGSHPSAAGAYLTACVFYLELTGGDLSEVRYEGRLPASAAKALREAAVEAVEANR